MLLKSQNVDALLFKVNFNSFFIKMKLSTVYNFTDNETAHYKSLQVCFLTKTSKKLFTLVNLSFFVFNDAVKTYNAYINIFVYN